MRRHLLPALALVLAATSSFAEPADAQKQALARRIVTLWKPETVVLQMVQRPAADTMQQSRIALQGRVSDQVQAATLADIRTDVQKFVDDVTPPAVAAATKEDEAVVVPMLMQKFTTTELQQIVAMLESPVRGKFELEMPAMQKALAEKVTADVGPQINPKMKALTETVGTKLRKAAGQ